MATLWSYHNSNVYFKLTPSSNLSRLLCVLSMTEIIGKKVKTARTENCETEKDLVDES